MAKSKSGGTRSMLRGRVGSDVYSVGRDAKGKRQQVVRSLAETVANPQTVNQMRGRMIMSTIMQAQSALKPIIDHSFDNVSGVQPNLSEFIARNYALIKADIAANPASGNKFGLVAFNEKGAKQGQYIISDGQAAVPVAVTFLKSNGVLSIELPSDNITVGGLKSALGIGQEGYLTIVGLDTQGAAEYARLHVNYELADTTAISAANLSQVFQIEGNVTPVLAISSNSITATIEAIAGCSALIVTRKNANGFYHSKAQLGDETDFEYTADVALTSYPIGENKFLNGGSESFNPAPSPTPTPTPTPTEQKTLSFSAGSGVSNPLVRVSGSTITSGSSVNVGANVNFSGSVTDSGYHMEATLNGSPVTLSKSGNLYSGSFTMPNTNSTLVMSKVADEQPSGNETLSVNGTNVQIGGSGSFDFSNGINAIITVPQGSSFIGKQAAILSGVNSLGSIVTLQAGSNTLSVTSDALANVDSCQIYKGVYDFDNEGFINSEVLFTITKEDDEND